MGIATLKAALRPAYRKFVQGQNLERDSRLALMDIGSLTYAYRSGSTDEYILRNVAGYEFRNIAPGYLPSPDDTIINVGAHIGAFVLPAAKHAARVFGIEAGQDTFNFLRINKALNRADNLSIHQFALTDRDGPCTLYFDTGHWGHSITKQLSRRTETVRGITLDTFFRENNIDYCDLMFFNCEGAEFPILLNTPPDTLRKIRTIAADCHVALWSHNTIEDLTERLSAIGFETRLINVNGGYDRVIAVRS